MFIPVTRGTDVDGGSSATTASVTAESYNLYFLSVNSNTNITADPNTPSITGNSLTWNQVLSVVYDTSGPTRKRLTLFSAIGSSPTTGTIAIDFSSQNQTIVNWMLDRLPISGAVVQSSSTNREIVGNTDIIVSLSTLARQTNRVYGVYTINNTNISTYTAGNWLNILQNNGNETTDLQMCTIHGVGKQTVDFDWGAGAAGNITCGIACEIACPPVGLLSELPDLALPDKGLPISELIHVRNWF